MRRELRVAKRRPPSTIRQVGRAGEESQNCGVSQPATIRTNLVKLHVHAYLGLTPPCLPVPTRPGRRPCTASAFLSPPSPCPCWPPANPRRPHPWLHGSRAHPLPQTPTPSRPGRHAQARRSAPGTEANDRGPGITPRPASSLRIRPVPSPRGNANSSGAFPWGHRNRYVPKLRREPTIHKKEVSG
jgi:hypothetical protein